MFCGHGRAFLAVQYLAVNVEDDHHGCSKEIKFEDDLLACLWRLIAMRCVATYAGIPDNRLRTYLPLFVADANRSYRTMVWGQILSS